MKAFNNLDDKFYNDAVDLIKKGFSDPSNIPWLTMSPREVKRVQDTLKEIQALEKIDKMLDRERERALRRRRAKYDKHARDLDMLSKRWQKEEEERNQKFNNHDLDEKEAFSKTHYVRSFRRIGCSSTGPMQELIIVDASGKEEIIKGRADEVGKYFFKHTCGWLYSEDKTLYYTTKITCVSDCIEDKMGTVCYIKVCKAR